MDAEAYSHLLQTAAEVVKTITLALTEEEITPEDGGEMQAIMLNIMEYLYGKYGDYSKVDREVKNMIQTFYDPSLVEKGRKEGRKEGTRLILQKQINKRFGVVPRDIEERINALEQPQLEELAEKILEITTEEELRQAITIKH
jgi:hypothetical protein